MTCLFLYWIFYELLGSGWSVPVELIIGAEAGISYSTEQSHSPTLLAEFTQVTIPLYHHIYAEYSNKLCLLCYVN